jgi:adhesin transport system membrane fusion protein
LKGKVTLISADTFKDEKSRAADGDPHYKVTLSVDAENLTDRQANIAIRPGMQASVELHTGSKTILQYLLKPLYKSREAFHEP